MTRLTLPKMARIAAISLVGATLLSTAAAAQSVKVEGLIKARDGETMILQTSDSPKLSVLLTDNTEVGQVQGVLKARRKEMSMAALVPGLKIKVEGTTDKDGQLVAEKVSFKGDDLQQAQSIQAG